MRRLWRPLFWTAATAAFVLATVPQGPRLPVPDKVVHAFAFVTLAALGLLAYPAARKRYLLLGLAAYGALIELVQGLSFIGRDEDPLDWVTDVAAAFAVFAAVALWVRSKGGDRKAPPREPRQRFRR